MLVLLAGLPGTGKSMVAAVVAQALGACVVSADPVDAALAVASVPNPEGRVGYELMKALATNDFNAGRSVVIDAVNPFAFVCQAYLDLASTARAAAVVVVTICSDEDLHRATESRSVAGTTIGRSTGRVWWHSGPTTSRSPVMRWCWTRQSRPA